ncbi:MAG: hypothetical protein KDJ90_17245 [Nitratireductor sp.]|nr:hypothetical protein [Nitratireductor sp.]
MSYDLTPGEELTHILYAAQSLLDANYPLDRLRDSAHVDGMAPLADFGAFLLSLPEESGGAGFSALEEAHLHAALGRHLLAPTALASTLAARIALETGRDGLAQAIASGETRVCAGVSTRNDHFLFEPDGAAMAVIRTDDGLNLVGLKDAEMEPATAMGHGRPLSRLKDVRSVGNGFKADEETARLHALLTSAQLLGVARAARDLAVDYAGTREQFGRPIGSFQAIKHHCANMAIGVEMVSAQLDMAAIAVRDGREDAAFQTAALARLAPRVALQNARLCIQIHGGIGFSAEADVQLFLKQAHLLRNYLGATDFLSLPSPMFPLAKVPA